MRVRVIASAGEVKRDMATARTGLPAARRGLLRNLAIQTHDAARDLADGSPTAAPGSYPIPRRTGAFKGTLGHGDTADKAFAFSTSAYAIPLHEGFRPYGNPNAHAIPPRRYFDDALDKLDMDAAWQAFDDAMIRAPGAAP